jgi:hypothetical protein
MVRAQARLWYIWIVRRSAALVASFFVFACAAPDAPVDAAPDAPARRPLLAAAATADITPPPGITIVGYGSRTSTSVRDPLEAAVLVLRDGPTTAALVTIDLPGISEWHASLVRALVASRTGAAPEDVLVAASHTHSAPMLGDDPWSRRAIDEIGRAAAEAARELDVASLAYGEGTIDFDVNRRLVVGGEAVPRPNPDGLHDPRVRVLALRTRHGTTRAVVSHAVCHPNVLLGPTSTEISADFPGEARIALRDLAAPWLFANGSAGDVRPNVVGADGEFRLGDDADLVRIGAELADATRGALASAVELSATPLRTAHARPLVPHVDGGSGEVELGAMRIGDVVLLTIPGEPLVEIGLEIERRLAEALGPGVRALVVGYANGHLDYIVTENAARYRGYEVERAIIAPGAALTIEDELVALAVSLY